MLKYVDNMDKQVLWQSNADSFQELQAQHDDMLKQHYNSHHIGQCLTPVKCQSFNNPHLCEYITSQACAAPS